MPKKDRKCPGLANLLAEVVAEMRKSKTFTCADAVAFMIPVLGFEPGMKSVARALSFLCLRGDVRVMTMRHRPGENFAVNVYGRGDGPKPMNKPKSLPPELPGVVIEKALAPGHRRVTFGKAWKPYREPKTERPWRGYESSLAKV